MRRGEFDSKLERSSGLNSRRGNGEGERGGSGNGFRSRVDQIISRLQARLVSVAKGEGGQRTNGSVNGEGFGSDRREGVGDGLLVSIVDRDDLVVGGASSVVEEKLVWRKEGVRVDGLGELEQSCARIVRIRRRKEGENKANLHLGE